MNTSIKQLIELRETYQLTAQFIADRLQTSERNVWRWLSNSHEPSLENIGKIEKFCEQYQAKMLEEAKADLGKCMSSILNKIYDDTDDFQFMPAPKPGEKYVPATYPVGLIWRSISLQDCGEVTDKRTDDPLLIKALQLIASSGRIKIFRMNISKKLNDPDVSFDLFLGEARREGFQRPQFTRSYKNKLLEGDELKDVDIEARVENMRREKKKVFDRMHGSRNLEVENRLLREEIEDASELRTAQLRAGGNKMGEKMKGKKQTSEDELEEIRISNDKLSPEIHYDWEGKKILIQPGESKIVVRRKQPKVN